MLVSLNIYLNWRMKEINEISAPRPPGVRCGDVSNKHEIKTAHNKPAHARARILEGPRASLRWHSLTPLSHIALASEPAKSYYAGSLYRLGQRRRRATVRCNTLLQCLGLLQHARASGRRARMFSSQYYRETSGIPLSLIINAYSNYHY
jgi:hypothetical protein